MKAVVGKTLWRRIVQSSGT